MAAKHVLTLATSDHYSAVFYCPICGHKKQLFSDGRPSIVLMVGNPDADHTTGSGGGVEIAEVSVNQNEAVDRETPFRNFMEECDDL